MNTDEAVAALDALDASDCEAAHGDADDILLAIVPADVVEAYIRVQERCPWWVTA